MHKGGNQSTYELRRLITQELFDVGADAVDTPVTVSGTEYHDVGLFSSSRQFLKQWSAVGAKEDSDGEPARDIARDGGDESVEDELRAVQTSKWRL
ncbi:MAG: hypothetical protein JWO88_2719 [Frankiales bacterium]|nr:hypothetical protein [Frankiales bacterium]